jgi:glycosyltransferase involved in cell wall biosynthesis
VGSLAVLHRTRLVFLESPLCNRLSYLLLRDIQHQCQVVSLLLLGIQLQSLVIVLLCLDIQVHLHQIILLLLELLHRSLVTSHRLAASHPIHLRIVRLYRLSLRHNRPVPLHLQEPRLLTLVVRLRRVECPRRSQATRLRCRRNLPRHRASHLLSPVNPVRRPQTVHLPRVHHLHSRVRLLLAQANHHLLPVYLRVIQASHLRFLPAIRHCLQSLALLLPILHLFPALLRLCLATAPVNPESLLPLPPINHR